MLKHLLLTLGIVLSTSLFVFSQSGALQGIVLDTDTKEPIPFANVAVFSGGNLVTGATTDFDGKYVIKPLTPGNYNVRASFVGYKSKEISGVVVKNDQIAFQDIALSVTAETLDVVEVVEYKVPLISKDKTTSGATVTSEEIQKMPNRSTNSIATTVGGVYSDADGGNISIRGQRSSGTAYYIDGMRVIGSISVPESAIEQVQVILGGTPARIGDATGGVISVTTKGPSREFGAGVEAQTSQFLDAFGYNRFGINLQGPLLSRMENGNKTSLLGYFLAGELVYRQDGRPSAKGTINQITDDYADFLRQTPQRPSGSGFGVFNNSLFTRLGNTKEVTNTQNTERLDISVSGKLDLRATPTIGLTVGGSYNRQDYRDFNYYNSLFNWENNRHVKRTTYRVFGRFTQRFPVEKESTSIIKNVFYSIQADYSRDAYTIEDDSHGDKLFNYGYLGKFETYKRRSYELGSDTVNGVLYSDVWVQNAWQDTAFIYTPYDINPVISRYTDPFDPLGNNWLNADQVQLFGGLLNGQEPDGVYSMWGSIGTQYNGFVKSDESQIGISANASADIGNHALEFGLQYEQRKESYYGYEPVQFWSLMRGYANAHIEQLDKANPQLVQIDGQFQDTINYNLLYSFTDQRIFDVNLRKRMGLPVQGTDWIDIDSYDPNTQTISYIDADGTVHKDIPVNGGLDVDMFSPDELLSNGADYVNYYGYDPFGNKSSARPAFDDFFNKTTSTTLPNGQVKEYNTRDIQAFEPIYMAGYIQDKFAFDDLIFNIGVRVDRFDANQNVLKDPYLLYSAYTVGEKGTRFDGSAHPSNIGSDAVIYVDNKDNPSAVVGYREEDVWYNASGAVIQNPNVLDAGSGITPYLIDPNQTRMSADVFEDYEPQVSVMPRISFSFPVSDESLFFAHYDILTQRPTSALRMDPTEYYYIQQQTGAINNPNLKPEKTIDYELGFQQKLSNTSSLKISSFYREIRDQIQYYRFTGAYTGGSNLYDSYANLDFSTVKGLTVEYDLRRTSNVRARISYTLQFAEGTGSSPNTARALVTAGLPNLRTILPLNWDRRHAFNIVLDYRFGEGKNYNGPTTTKQIKGTDQVKTTQWLQNTGLNITLSGGSGTPYTRSENIVGVYAGGGGNVLAGTINGSRLPWQFSIDGRLDRDIQVSKNPNSRTYLNVYLQVLNILNTKNIIGVYSATGSPDDDGYLTAPEFQSNINSSIDPQSYRDLYALRMNTPFNFSSPRQIRLGVTFNF